MQELFIYHVAQSLCNICLYYAEYLYSKYSLWAPPSELLRAASNIVTPLLTPIYKVIAPLQAGSKRENEFEYQSVVAEAKADIYDEISSFPVVVCE